MGRPVVPSHSSDDEDVAARELDDEDGHRPEDRANEKALAGTSDDDEIGIGGSRRLQDFVRRVAFPGDRANLGGAGSARPRCDRVGFGQQLRGLVARFDELLGNDAVLVHLRLDGDEDHLAARPRRPNAPRHRASRGVRAVVADDDAGLGCLSLTRLYLSHADRAPASCRGSGAAGVRVVARPLGWLGASSNACVTRLSALIPEAVVASVTSM